MEAISPTPKRGHVLLIDVLAWKALAIWGSIAIWKSFLTLSDSLRSLTVTSTQSANGFPTTLLTTLQSY